MTILVANSNLDNVGGSETFTYALIEALMKKGHKVEYFTFNKGFVAKKIEKNLNVFSQSRKIYDLILANHNTCVDKLHKYGFIIQTCHGIFPPLEQPSKRADAFVSISTEVQDHLGKLGFPSILIHNGINLERFYSKSPLNKSLQTVL